MNSSAAAVVMKIKQPPVVGRMAISLAPQEDHEVAFKVEKTQLQAFAMAIRNRKLVNTHTLIANITLYFLSV